MFDTDHERERWYEFIEAISRYGRTCFERSGINHVELGMLVRDMEAVEDRAGNNIMHNLFERFHDGLSSGPATTDVYNRYCDATHAAMAYSFNLRASQIHAWLMAAMRLHMGENLFQFMFAAKFGIEVIAGDELYTACYPQFQAWRNIIADVLQKEDGRRR